MIGIGIGPNIGGAAPWTPARFGSDLGLWAKIGTDATGSKATVSGTAVSAWNDRSGNARHLVQATGANQPAWVADDGDGRPAINCALAEADYLALAAGSNLLQNLSGAAIYVVLKPSSATDDVLAVWITLNGDSTVPRAALGVSLTTAGKYGVATCTTDSAGDFVIKEGGTAATAAYVVLGANWDFAGNSVDIRVNGSSVYSGVHGSTAQATPDTTSDAALVGLDGNAGTGAGKIREIVVVRRELTTAEASSLERYLLAGWGL